MHFIIRATIPNASGNKMVQGPMRQTFEKITADLKPEASFFAIEKGQRTVYFIVKTESGTDMVRIAEPLWLALEAEVDVIPAMNAEEFAAAGPMLAEVVGHY